MMCMLVCMIELPMCPGSSHANNNKCMYGIWLGTGMERGRDRKGREGVGNGKYDEPCLLISSLATCSSDRLFAYLLAYLLACSYTQSCFNVNLYSLDSIVELIDELIPPNQPSYISNHYTFPFSTQSGLELGIARRCFHGLVSFSSRGMLRQTSYLGTGIGKV